MNLRHFTFVSTISALAFGGALMIPPQAVAAEAGYEELTRGPVHEAFAETISYDPEPGMLVKTAPPGLIEEIPPEQRLEGDNVAWIPGYWGWEEEQNDFIWISGVWRNLPPDRQWVPGYWAEAESRWQWTSGYWANEAVSEVAYLPKPPKSLESGPNVAAPSRDHIWVSGSWVNHEERYAWRPGSWEPGQENWNWIPAHYQWTRRGYVFIDGYWDYDVARRGVVFAPVRFQRDNYNRPNFSYTPLMVISLNVFASHLFVRPRYGHYYFGDYYAPRYREQGFYASYSYGSGRRGYDPIDVQSRWQNRNDEGWARSRRANFEYYRDNESARPPQTWSAMQALPEDQRRGQRDNFQFAEPLNQYAASSAGGQRFQAVTADSRSRMVEQRQQVREFSKSRQQLESRAAQPMERQGDDQRIQAQRERIDRSPLMGQRAEQLSGNDAPPKRRAARAMESAPGSIKQDRPQGQAAQPGKNQAAQPERRDKPQEARQQPGQEPQRRKEQSPTARDDDSKAQRGASPERKQEAKPQRTAQPERKQPRAQEPPARQAQPE
ncbi:YXWGXW repeat-containing protein, partial [bacterium]|nr:YXWGXW repeat-containing protein [bacterium]